ncbi:hypothetical protein [Chitinimonas prasina]|uniref:hypothetical protein n=1 Tax=Chitinimonas prasina TaxID=1434937 RepID=UPI0024E121A4|nr:hypothetical protein [Chitinimonas prasina]
MIDPYSVSHPTAPPTRPHSLPILAAFCITIAALVAVVMLLTTGRASMQLLLSGPSFSLPVIAQHIQYGAIFYAFWCAIRRQHSPAKPLMLAALMTVPVAMLQRYDLISIGAQPVILVAAPIGLGLMALLALISCIRQARKSCERQGQSKE